MSYNKTWLLPDGIFDYLPDQAFKLEKLKHLLLEQMVSNGYQLVFTPLVEYVESLLTEDNPDLDLITFKVIDQLTGRLMGVRADITPQVARIDAHVRPSNEVERYCYAEEVVHTLPEGLSGLRSQFQLGAEIFGSDSIEVDKEIVGLLLDLVNQANLTVPLQLDIGHIGIFKRLTELSQLTPKQVKHITELYQRKAIPELKVFCNDIAGGQDLINLAVYGHDLDALKDHLSEVVSRDQKIQGVMSQLEQLRSTYSSNGNVTVSIDAAELQGYHYHTGLVFALYAASIVEPLAQGGRYDEIGTRFGRPRTATGFSCYLSKWLPFLPSLPQRHVISKPFLIDADQLAQLEQARQAAIKQGHIVIPELPEQLGPVSRATHRFTLQNQQWVAIPV